MTPLRHKRIRMPWVAFTFALATTAVAAQQPVDRPPQPRMQSIHALHLPALPGSGLPTYYSPGSDLQARRLRTFVQGEQSFYREKLGVPLNDLVLAVLNPQEWEPVSAPIPYGMPSVEGHPRVIVMPADWALVTAMPFPGKRTPPPRCVNRLPRPGSSGTSSCIVAAMASERTNWAM